MLNLLFSIKIVRTIFVKKNKDEMHLLFFSIDRLLFENNK